MFKVENIECYAYKLDCVYSTLELCDDPRLYVRHEIRHCFRCLKLGEIT